MKRLNNKFMPQSNLYKGDAMKKISTILLIVIMFLGVPSFVYCDDIKLMLPEVETKKQQAYSPSEIMVFKKIDGKQSYSEIELSKFVKPFEQEGYKVDQIELWLEGIAETGGITKLFVSFEGKGGCKIILKPRR